MFKFILASLIALMTVSAMATSHSKEEFKPYGEGLPMPWPFPWAEGCPVKWSSMSGRYQLIDSDAGHEVELKISIVSEKGLRFMRISRFNREGVMISDGLTALGLNQRSIQVRLLPLVPGTYPVYASLKLHYETSDYSCAMDRLVPILALTEKKPDQVSEVQYRLVKRPIN